MDATGGLVDAARLPDILEEYRGRLFEWGTLDCCLFATAVVRDLTGVDYAAEYRGKYDSKREAIELIKKHGGLEKMLDAHLPPSQALSEARRGDFLMASVPSRTLGVCVGAKGVFKTMRGLVSLPVEHCERSWSCLKR